MYSAFRKLCPALALLVVTAVPAVGWAQTGGTTGTATSGTLTKDSFFLGVQKEKGVNLTDYNRPKFLNRASCQCQRPMWLNALLQPSATAAAASVSPTALVSMYIGDFCNSSTENLFCKQLASGVPFSEFRRSGILASTNVEEFTTHWSRNPFTSCAGTCGAGGVSGSGGVSGTGGVSGSGGVSGTGGGTGSGGASGTGGISGTGGGSGTCGPCDGVRFDQTVWLLISSGTLGDVAQAQLTFSVDPEPPPCLTVQDPGAANEALIVNWTGLDTVTVGGDLLGYQVLCSRADTFQVFKTGTFGAAFDSCNSDATDPIATLDPDFACSGLLSTATNSVRLKVLENRIVYGVGVVAIDKSLNASRVRPVWGTPIETTDFYSLYRKGDPQGKAAGGYCSVAGATAPEQAITSLWGLAVLGLALARRRPPRSRA